YHTGSLNRTSPPVNSCCYGTRRTLTFKGRKALDEADIRKLAERYRGSDRLEICAVEQLRGKGEIVAEGYAGCLSSLISPPRSGR
ncbi:hypothetical protein, partial [Burkholderia stagnalis]|uniref:hypothetical protein n=1 Tax=Burkholderia stagnalis TaxID=1503054 RepID=UPI001C8ADEE3